MRWGDNPLRGLQHLAENDTPGSTTNMGILPVVCRVAHLSRDDGLGRHRTCTACRCVDGCPHHHLPISHLLTIRRRHTYYNLHSFRVSGLCYHLHNMAFSRLDLLPEELQSLVHNVRASLLSSSSHTLYENRDEGQQAREVRYGRRYAKTTALCRQLSRIVRRFIHQLCNQSCDFTATTEQTLTKADRTIQLAIDLSDALLERCTTTHTELLVLTQRRYWPRLLTWLNPLSLAPLYAVAVLVGALVGIIVGQTTVSLASMAGLALAMNGGTAGAIVGAVIGAEWHAWRADPIPPALDPAPWQRQAKAITDLQRKLTAFSDVVDRVRLSEGQELDAAALMEQATAVLREVEKEDVEPILSAEVTASGMD